VSVAHVDVAVDDLGWAIGSLRAGRPVVLIDDLGAEPSVLLVGAARTTAATLVVDLLHHTSGILGVTVEPSRLAALGIPSWEGSSGETMARSVVVLGPGDRRSVPARAATITALADDDADRGRFASPGCVFPVPTDRAALLRAPSGSDLAAALVELATGVPVAVFATALDHHRNEVGRADAAAWATRSGFHAVLASDVLAAHCRQRPVVVREAGARLPTAIDPAFRVTAYAGADGASHLALTVGDLSASSRALAVDECGFAPFRPRSCRCHVRLDRAMRTVSAAGSGLVIYLRGGRGAPCPDVSGAAAAHRSVAGIVRACTIAAIHEDQVLTNPPRTEPRRQPC